MNDLVGIHITTELRSDQEIQPLAVAKVFEFLAKREKADAIILGKQAIDGDNCQTGPMTAALLGWPQCTFAAALRDDPDSASSKVIRCHSRESEMKSYKACASSKFYLSLLLDST